MTVIAWDGKNLACDSRLTEAGRFSSCQKFWVTPKGTYIGTGTWTAIRKVVRHLSEGSEPDEELYKKAVVVLLDPNGRLWLYEDNDPQPIRRPDAWGSGRDFALGALSMGATAKEAAQVACKHSTTCGGKVYTFTI